MDITRSFYLLIVGSIPAEGTKFEGVVDKIKNNITIDENDCWNWKKSCSSSGYGQFRVDGVYYNAHRYAYQRTFGEPKEGNLIRHTCGNRRCCNPEHLEEGTNKDNYHDSKLEHDEGSKKLRKVWLICGIQYDTLRQASKLTGMHQGTIIKYTDSITRVFDVAGYRSACMISNKIPKI